MAIMQIFQKHRLTIIGCLIISILITLSYSNSLHGNWFFDDIPNILTNEPVHMESLDFQSIKRTFFAPPSHVPQLFRPVAVFTFGLNWYFGGNNVFGYHLVNVAIHILAAIGVFFLISALYDTPRLRMLRNDKTIYIAMLGAALWALNPVQTQAITYIVQRMASLAALFYIYAMLTYIYARRKPIKESWALYLVTFLLFLLSTFSKENGIILPCSLILTEIVFISNHNISLKKIFYSLIFGLVISYPLLFLVSNGGLNFLSGYATRGFTLTERLLTEPSVLVYYMSLLLYPHPDRLSLIYDFPISTSLFTPLTTIAAIITLLVMTVSSVLFYRNKPILSFAFLFFLLNHMVESSVWPLEILFEHRNYLPSIFFFWPMAAGLVSAITYFLHKKRTVALALLTLTVAYTLTFGLWTFARNSVWKDEKTLWSDVMVKHPGLARPYQMMAMLLETGGYHEQALHFYQLGLEKKDLSSPKRQQFTSYNNMGLIYLKLGKYQQALNSFHTALNIQPGSYQSYQNLILTYLTMGNYEEAERLTDLALADEESQQNLDYLAFKAIAVQKSGRPQEAVAYYQKIVRQHPKNNRSLVNLSLALAQADRYEEASHYLNKIPLAQRNSILYQLVQLENELRGGSRQEVERIREQIFAHHTREEINTILQPAKQRLSGLDLVLLAPLLEQK